MSPLLTFTIPTYNRAEKVKRCLQSIASQAVAFPDYVEIFVSDHESTDHTAIAIEEVQKEFPSVPITYAVLVHAPQDGYEANYKFVADAPTTPWAWTMGDDDYLLPGMLQAVLDLIKQAEPEEVKFICMGVKQRESPTKTIHRGLVIELCNQWGWIEMLGFISSCLVKTEFLKAAVNLPSWGTYRNPFSHACALLEVLAPHRGLFLDIAVLDNQDYVFTKQTEQEWNRHNVATRYFYLDEALRDMVTRKVIPPEYDLTFFRYHTYYLWDRFIGNMVSQYSNHPDDRKPELWPHIKGLADFLHPEDAATLRDRCDYVEEAINMHLEALDILGERSVILSRIVEDQNKSKFSWSYSGPVHVYEMDKNAPPPGINGIAQVMWFSQHRQRTADLKFLSPHKEIVEELRTRSLVDFPGIEPENPEKSVGVKQPS